MLKNFFLYKFSFVILAIPVLLITGPFLPDLILSLSCIFFIFLTIKDEDYYIYNNLFAKFFLSFWILLIFSSLISNNILPSLKSSFFYFRFGLFILILNYLITKNQSFEEKFVKICFYSILLVVISCLIEFFILRIAYFTQLYEIYISNDAINFNVQASKLTNSVNNRISGLFGSEGVAGSYILRLLPFFFLYCLNFLKKDILTKKKIFIYNLIFFLIIFSVLISGERASLLLLVLNVFLNFLIIKKIRNLFKFSIFASIIVLISSVYFDPIIKSRIIYETKHQLNYLYDHSKKDESDKANRVFIISELHEGHFRAAWKIFSENKIFGAGMKGFRFECYNNEKFKLDKTLYCSTHPHNTFMQFLSETGITGSIFYIAILVLLSFEILKNFYLVNIKNKRTDYNLDFKNCALIGIFVNIWPLTTSGNFFNNWLSILYFLPVVFYLRNKKILKNENNS
tara:strand:- start:4193 stop:5560 length:1368 start_codon:yes stop_codon:yes gene_type:complete